MMKSKFYHLVVLFFLVFIDNDVRAQAPAWEWAKGIGNLSGVYPANQVLDKSANIYIIGNNDSTVDFDPGPGIYNLSSGTFISKFDNSGNFVWARSLMVIDAFNISVDDSGNVYIAGYFFNTIDVDPDSSVVYNLTSRGAQDVFILKLSSSGNFVWAKSFGGAAFDHVDDIANDESGNVYATGSFYGTLDFNPDSTGIFNLTAGSFDEDIFILKLDSAGNFLWAKRIGGSGLDVGYTIAVDRWKNVLTSGRYSGTVDFDPGPGISTLPIGNLFISKLDSLGNFLWVKGINTSPLDPNSYPIVIDTIGNVYFTNLFIWTIDLDPDTLTIFNLTSSGGSDVFVCKLNSSGNFVWGKSFGDSCNEFAGKLSVNSVGSVYIAGTFESQRFIFDSDTLFNASNLCDIDNMFIAKLGTINTGIETITSNNNFSIYPNPATNLLHLTLTKPLPPNTTLTIMDTQARIVKQERISQGNSTIQVDVSKLTQGVYLIKVNGQVQRFVKM